ncbi:MAG: hypothetical protein ACT4OJ_10410 [Bacteroidota bacterium]
MVVARRYIIYFIALALTAGCKKKKQVSLAGDEPVEVSDFIAFFQPVTLPFQYADSSLQKTKKENDSLFISYKVFAQLVPDSFLTKLYGKGAKPKIYAMGKAAVPKAETYLFVKAVHAGKRSVLILAFDKKQQFAGAMPALRPDQNAATRQTVIMDRKYTITKTMLRRNKDGSLSEGRDVYVLNADAKTFSLIMTDALEDKPTELINPIDTLTRKFKWTADYSNGKMNLVSIRDGRRSNQLSFFIHFEKNSGKCSGELKGDAIITGSNTAEYRKDGDPCKLKFIFTSSSVTLKEMEGCGSYRPLNCSFDGSFARKKETKPKQTAVKKSPKNK